MFALLAFLVFVVAWAVHVIGDGLTNPWAWLLAGLAFLSLEVALHERVGLSRWWRA
jgi:hypothetical protein